MKLLNKIRSARAIARIQKNWGHYEDVKMGVLVKAIRAEKKLAKSHYKDMKNRVKEKRKKVMEEWGDGKGKAYSEKQGFTGNKRSSGPSHFAMPLGIKKWEIVNKRVPPSRKIPGVTERVYGPQPIKQLTPPPIPGPKVDLITPKITPTQLSLMCIL